LTGIKSKGCDNSGTPQIPIGALKIIRCIREIEVGIAERVYWSLEVKFEPGFYPPEIIESCLNQSDIVWIMDLLDRFGGELVCGEKICKISRLQPKAASLLGQCG
jgi:hypothetical protein